MHKCNCKSNHLDTEGDEVILLNPHSYGLDEDVKKLIAVDACIAYWVEALWLQGIWTIGSCCGHNLREPAIILAHAGDAKSAHDIINAITNEDGLMQTQRPYQLSACMRVIV